MYENNHQKNSSLSNRSNYTQIFQWGEVEMELFSDLKCSRICTSGKKNFHRGYNCCQIALIFGRFYNVSCVKLWQFRLILTSSKANLQRIRGNFFKLFSLINFFLLLLLFSLPLNEIFSHSIFFGQEEKRFSLQNFFCIVFMSLMFDLNGFRMNVSYSTRLRYINLLNLMHTR